MRTRRAALLLSLLGFVSAVPSAMASMPVPTRSLTVDFSGFVTVDWWSLEWSLSASCGAVDFPNDFKDGDDSCAIAVTGPLRPTTPNELDCFPSDSEPGIGTLVLDQDPWFPGGEEEMALTRFRFGGWNMGAWTHLYSLTTSDTGLVGGDWESPSDPESPPSRGALHGGFGLFGGETLCDGGDGYTIASVEGTLQLTGFFDQPLVPSDHPGRPPATGTGWGLVEVGDEFTGACAEDAIPGTTGRGLRDPVTEPLTEGPTALAHERVYSARLASVLVSDSTVHEADIGLCGRLTGVPGVSPADQLGATCQLHKGDGISGSISVRHVGSVSEIARYRLHEVDWRAAAGGSVIGWGVYEYLSGSEGSNTWGLLTLTGYMSGGFPCLESPEGPGAQSLSMTAALALLPPADLDNDGTSGEPEDVPPIDEAPLVCQNPPPAPCLFPPKTDAT